MVQCPRCGFEQPRDRFCAKCGIVMEGFVPKKRPATDRLGTWGFVAIFLLAVSLGAFFFYKRNQDSDTFGPSAPPAQSEEKAPSDSNQAQVPATNEPPARRPEPSNTSTKGLTAYAELARPSPTEQGRANEPNGVQVEFDLVSRDVMDRMTQEGEGRLDVGRYSMSIVPQFKSKYDGVRTETGFVSLASESRNLALGQPSLVFRGGKEPKSNDTIGFYVEVTPSHATDKGMEYKISIKRSLPELTPAGEFKVTTQNFEESAMVPHNAAVLFAGLLPRKAQLLEGEDELYKSNILRAFLEPAFEKGDEEFVILVNPHFNDPVN